MTNPLVYLVLYQSCWANVPQQRITESIEAEMRVPLPSKITEEYYRTIDNERIKAELQPSDKYLQIKSKLEFELQIRQHPAG
ncbi:MAG: hypothetical protein AABX12_04695 [Nanoarchaeota archaeon]